MSRAGQLDNAPENEELRTAPVTLLLTISFLKHVASFVGCLYRMSPGWGTWDTAASGMYSQPVYFFALSFVLQAIVRDMVPAWGWKELESGGVDA